MRLWTEVKCYSCSRVCGELEGVPPSVWLLISVDHMLPGIHCSVTSLADLRCSRCGGTVYPREIAPEDAQVRVSQSDLDDLGEVRFAA